MIRSSGGLSQADIEKMVRDAETFADKDKERRAVIDVRNEGDSLLYSAEKNLEEHRANISQVRLAEAGERGGSELDLTTASAVNRVWKGPVLVPLLTVSLLYNPKEIF